MADIVKLIPRVEIEEPAARNLHARVRFYLGRQPYTTYLAASDFAKSAREPVRLKGDGRGKHHYWLYDGDVYSTTDLRLAPDDVRALANEAENKRRIRLEKAHALQAMRDEGGSRAHRQPIPQEVKVEVWRRDGGRCVQCDINQNLEFDHIIPLAMGGSNSVRNLQLLCGDCNRRKGASLG